MYFMNLNHYAGELDFLSRKLIFYKYFFHVVRFVRAPFCDTISHVKI